VNGEAECGAMDIFEGATREMAAVDGNGERMKDVEESVLNRE
jgi:hypothetical protein